MESKKTVKLMLNLGNTLEKEIAADREMEKGNIITIMETCMMDSGRETRNMDLDATHSLMEECKLFLFSIHIQNHPQKCA